MPSGGDFRFGPYRLDPRSQRLFRDEVAVSIQARQLQLLQFFVEHPDTLLTKDELVAAVWKGIVVTDASLTQAVFHLRNILDPADPARYIETAARLGYRFVVPVTRAGPRGSDAEIDALLAPHRAALDGRAALEALQLDRVARARSTYEALLARRDDDPRAHVGLANACLEQFEATRADLHPDVEALERAVTHAREGVLLNLDYADAWATLGLALERIGDRTNALAALRRAIELEPNEWAHHLRLAWASWGRERLSATRRMLDLMPASPAAHWLAATVHVARNALAEAEREVDAGIAAMAPASVATDAFPPIALHLLKGLLLLARGADEEAVASFKRELDLGRGHIYARETEANTWYAIGACHLRRGDRETASAAFGEAIARVPGHAMAWAGLEIAGRSSASAKATADRSELPESRNAVDAALATAALLVARGDAADAARIVADALAGAPPGNAGWLIPIEPLLRVDEARAAWAPVLALLRTRAM